MSDTIDTEQFEIDFWHGLDDGAVWTVPVLFDWNVPSDLYSYENINEQGV